MAYTNPASPPQFQSYDQKGRKLSFANWISNISPEETPFVSMTGKESIDQVQFTWQVDNLAKANSANAQPEGFVANPADTLQPTMEIQNNTQLLAKVISVSDTANATANYGRGRELMYQLEKAGAEIKRDLEAVFLNNDEAVNWPTKPSATPFARTTGGVKALIGETGSSTTQHGTVNQAGHTGTKPDLDFGAVVRSTSTTTTGATGNIDPVLIQGAIFSATEQLYLAGAKANTIMIHPSLASVFSTFQETPYAGNLSTASRVRMFENRKDIDVQVNQITDPLGQKFRVVYNRHMPKDATTGDTAIFIFNPADWTQMVLRAPLRTELAKNGDSTQYMITMECGLRHRNPYASAWVDVVAKA